MHHPATVGTRLRHHTRQAAAIAKVADGVVVGSAVIDIVAQYGADAPPYVQAYVASLAEAVHSATKEPAQ